MSEEMPRHTAMGNPIGMGNQAELIRHLYGHEDLELSGADAILMAALYVAQVELAGALKRIEELENRVTTIGRVVGP